MRMKGDKVVNAVLDNAIQRESEFTRKGSTAVREQQVHNWAMNKNCVKGEMPTFPVEVRTKETATLASQIIKSVKAKVTEDSMSSQHVHLQTL